MAVKHLIVLSLFVAAGVSETTERIFWGIPPTVVNGLRCYWKYTCYLPGKHSTDTSCNIYVPQKFCEDVKIQVKEDNSQVDQLGFVTEKGNQRSTTESSSKTVGSVTTKLPPPTIDPFVVIDAPVNCGPDELPDHYGKCKMVFGRSISK